MLVGYPEILGVTAIKYGISEGAVSIATELRSQQGPQHSVHYGITDILAISMFTLGKFDGRNLVRSNVR